MCLLKEEVGITSGREPYILYDNDDCTYSLDGKSTDQRYEVIGYVWEDILFHENGLMEDLKRLPEFNTVDMNRYKWTISQAPVFMWSKECIDKYNI